MSHLAIRGDLERINLELGRLAPLSDAELFDLCARNPELRIERTREGDLIVMTPTGGETSHRNLRIAATLSAWADRDGEGVAFDSSGGFVLANGAMRSPEAAWLRKSRLTELRPEAKKGLLPLCPDFVVELLSPSDRRSELEVKMEEYRDNGALLGWLIDPDARQVVVYRPERPAEVLDQPTRIAGEPELAGLILDLVPIWEGL